MGGPFIWDVNTPAPTETRRQGDNRIKEVKGEHQRGMTDGGPMPNWPTDNHCGLGWGRIFVFDTLLLLQANAVATPYNRLGFVRADPDTTKNGMYLEESTGWRLIQG